jgi:hypothetical protein
MAIADGAISDGFPAVVSRWASCDFQVLASRIAQLSAPDDPIGRN